MTGAWPMSMSTRLVRSDRQISCDVGDEVVLLSISDGEYYGLNPVAASIWRRISAPCTLEMVRDTLLGEYNGISRDDCEQAVLSFATELVTLGAAKIQ